MLHIKVRKSQTTRKQILRQNGVNHDDTDNVEQNYWSCRVILLHKATLRLNVKNYILWAKNTIRCEEKLFVMWKFPHGNFCSTKIVMKKCNNYLVCAGGCCNMWQGSHFDHWGRHCWRFWLLVKLFFVHELILFTTPANIA